MRYDVTYLLAGEEQTARLDAPDAAAAAAVSEATHARPSAPYELLRVHLVDTPPTATCGPRRLDGDSATA